MNAATGVERTRATAMAATIIKPVASATGSRKLAPLAKTPPSIGPASPPSSAARETRATAVPYTAGGHHCAANVSTAGTATAPNAPCRARISINWLIDEGHHSASCTSPWPNKPISNSRRAGNRSNSQPHIGDVTSVASV